MPELPEVESLKRKLEKCLVGKTISKVDVLAVKSFAGNSSELIGVQIIGVRRVAKILLLDLSNTMVLAVHLKMTGQLIYTDEITKVGGGHPTADWVQHLPSSHTRVFFTFSDGSNLFFNDQRLFGWIKVLSKEAENQLLSPIAPDVIDEQVTATWLFKKLQKSRRPIKVVIMDSTVVAGVGNIYACEALYLAKIAPTVPASMLTFIQVETLLTIVKKIILLAIDMGGTTTDGKFVDESGFAGSYQTQLLVYDKAGSTCSVCGSKILKKKISGRGTYYCPMCQN